MRRVVTGLGGTALALVIAAPAAAQNAPADAATKETAAAPSASAQVSTEPDIVVTAQKRENRLIDVP